MSAAHEADLRKHVRTYVRIFAVLAVLTVVTVSVSYLHLPIAGALVIALLIASVKGSLVAGWFMHLVAERKPVYGILILTAFFFVFLLLWPMLDLGNGIGRPTVMQGVEAPWNPSGARGGGPGHAGQAGHAGQVRR